MRSIDESVGAGAFAEKLNRKINLKEYREIENYLYTLELNNGYMQDLGKHEEEYVPKFDFKGI